MLTWKRDSSKELFSQKVRSFGLLETFMLVKDWDIYARRLSYKLPNGWTPESFWLPARALMESGNGEGVTKNMAIKTSVKQVS
jgi:hypothetical protein